MSVEEHVISFSLEVNVDDLYQNIRRVQALIFRTISLLRRMGLPEEVDAAIVKLQRLITILNMARLTIIAYQAASGPIGWAMFAVGAAATIASAGDLIMEAGS